MKTLKISLILMFVLILSSMLSAQGNFELGFHYGPWSLSLFEGMIEEGLSEALEEQLTERIMEDVQEEHPNLELTSYKQTISFGSGSHNWGFGFRWYPKGKTGSFSLGLSIEKTKMRTIDRNFLLVEEPCPLSPAHGFLNTIPDPYLSLSQ